MNKAKLILLLHKLLSLSPDVELEQALPVPWSPAALAMSLGAGMFLFQVMTSRLL